MRLFLIVFLAGLSVSFAKDCSKVKKSNSKLFCYYSKLTDSDGCFCTHVILPENADDKTVQTARQLFGDRKILVTVNHFNQGLINLLKNTKVDGLEINLKKLDSKNDITDFISTVRSKLGSDLYLAVAVPPKSEILAKYYDFKGLSKHADVFILQTAFLGASRNVTFHPSRLSGIWDMQNTDSIVDLVSGLGAPLSKVVISAPVQAFDFTLQNEEYSAVGSPAIEVKSITRDELCSEMNKGPKWTLERDQDQTGPYIFSGNKWIAFEDTSSIDIKAKYSRVRGLAGMALKDVSQDGGSKCGGSLLETAYNGLSRQSRAPRQALLHSLEREILETPNNALGSIHVSPFRISRIIDVEGKWHIVRQDTRTEFTCTRQGYFVHPRSCNRFYRCVKFDQLVDDYNVFEFDCPAGLAFDERVEVCVWPGSLPEGQPCAGSSEIAPVPRERFNCPHEPGYYADPENCRWFFACIDHGKSALTAYEFRCPFGLVFDSDRYMCEWPWLVPKCGSGSGLGINLASEYYYGGYSSGQGNYQTVNSLQSYDGLGTLGAIKLAGVQGKIQQPLISSNIGVSGYQGIGGIGSQAAQSLYNSGLLKNNVDGSYLSTGAENLNLINTGANLIGQSIVRDEADNSLGAGIVQQNYLLKNINTAAAQEISNGDLKAKTGYVQVTQNFVPTANAQSAYSQSTVDGGSGVSNYNENFVAQAFGVSNKGLGAQILSNAGLKAQAGNAGAQNAQSVYSHSTVHGYSGNENYDGNFGAKTVGVSSVSEPFITVQQNLGSYQTVDTYSTEGISGSQYQNNQYNTRNNGGSHSYQTSSQDFNQNAGGDSVLLHGQENGDNAISGALYNTGYLQNEVVQNVGSSGNINIVGGGYSAVGQTQADGEVANIGIGDNQPKIALVVPTVTAVPIPSIKTEHRFQSFQGGVIANVPQLQYNVHDTSNLTRASDVRVGTYDSVPAFVQSNTYVTASTPPTIIEGQKPLVSGNDQYQGIYPGANSFTYHSQDYSNTGYVYSKPSVSFEEGNQLLSNIATETENKKIQLVSSTARPNIVVEQNAPIAVNVQEHSGYIYSKPQIKFEEVAPKLTVTIPSRSATVQPIVSFSTPRPLTFVNEKIQPIVSVQPQVLLHQEPQVYVSSTRSPLVESVSTYSVNQKALPYVPVQPVINYKLKRPEVKLQPQVVLHQQQQVYVSSTPTPFVESVSTYSVNQKSLPVASGQPVINYNLRKPEFRVEPQVILNQQPQVYISSTPAALVESVSTYSGNQNSLSGGYQYSQPVVQLSEEPKQRTQNKIISSYSIRQPVDSNVYLKPALNIESVRFTPTQSSYSTQRPETYVQDIIQTSERPAYVDNSVPVGASRKINEASALYTQYHYEKPAVTQYTYKDIVQNIKLVQPVITHQVPVVTTTPEPVIYNHHSIKNEQNVEFTGYSYPKPQTAFVEEPKIVQEIPFVKKTAYVTGQNNYKSNRKDTYNYVAAVDSSTPAIPVVVENYQAPVLQEQQYQTYQADTYDNINNGERVTYSTPRPTYKSTVSSIISKSSTSAPQEFYFYDSRLTTSKPVLSGGYSYSKPSVVFEEEPAIPTYLSSTTENYVPIQTVSTSKPIAKYSFSSFDKQYVAKPVVISTPTPFVQTYSTVRTRPVKPVVVENYQASIPYEDSSYQLQGVISSTPKPTFYSTIASVRPKVVSTATEAPFYYFDSRFTSPSTEDVSIQTISTTSRPTEAYSVSTLGSYTRTPVITSTYVPVKTRVRVTTAKPVYVPQRSRIRYTSTTEPSISTYSSSEYLPVEKLSTISLPVEVTTPSNEYLPVRSRVTTAIPRVNKINIEARRPLNIGKTIIKQNDFLPLLSTKLGAQCTCTSSNLNVRKKQRIIIVDDNGDDDGYIVDNNTNNQGVVVENYQYEPQNVVDITPTPQVYLKSSTPEAVLTPTYRIRTRQRVSTKVTEDYREQDDTPSDKEIVKAVKTGLKLVKQAAKEGAKEGTEEALQNNELRVRDRIECQRAGLFRHPNQCNKFYSCKWDCTKNKYILHSFNCPIQLTFDSNLGACNWPSQGPACAENTLLPIQ